MQKNKAQIVGSGPLVIAQAEVGGSYYVPPEEHACSHQEYIPLMDFSEVPTQIL